MALRHELPCSRLDPLSLFPLGVAFGAMHRSDTSTGFAIFPAAARVNDRYSWLTSTGFPGALPVQLRRAWLKAVRRAAHLAACLCKRRASHDKAISFAGVQERSRVRAGHVFVPVVQVDGERFKTPAKISHLSKNS